MRSKTVRPLRVNVTTAAALLDVQRDYVLEAIKQGVFTVIAPTGRGRGRRLYLLPEEVEAFAAGGPDAVKLLRAGAN